MTTTISLADVISVSPLLALFLFSLLPLTIKVLRGNQEPPALATLLQGLGGIVTSAILLMFVYSLVHEQANPTAFANALVLDGVTITIGLLALAMGFGSLLLMYENPATKGRQFSELVFLTLNAILGMLILVSAVDLLVVFIGLEMMSLSLYMMIAISHEEKLAKESALKYFILGGFASAIFLYGVAFLFGTVGSTYLPQIISSTGDLVSSSRLFLFGLTMVIIGFCFKVSIAPFHAWTPDVYQGAPTPHTALMATAVKAVSIAAFLRVLSTKALVGSENLLDLLQWLAVITMFVGNVAALIQNNLKRILAYSSVAHSGYLMVGLITTGVSDELTFAASGVLFYLLGYSVMTLGAFALVSVLEKDEKHSISVSDLSGLARRRPWMALSLTALMLSLAGLPPTVGFFGKFYMFSAAIGEGLLWLAIWGVINSVVSVYYYLRPLVVMYMHEGEGDLGSHRLYATRTAVVVTAILVVLLGVFSGPLFQAIEKAVS